MDSPLLHWYKSNVFICNYVRCFSRKMKREGALTTKLPKEQIKYGGISQRFVRRVKHRLFRFANMNCDLAGKDTISV